MWNPQRFLIKKLFGKCLMRTCVALRWDFTKSLGSQPEKPPITPENKKM